ncbi:class I SAM-dependent methyltransferase [Blastococcus jejuensis]|uniref:Class I SAM-dependent methyltransferase n=1 Tax=Blastococcus jejuensis TaxID=351224 RepID=A0ABP6PQJ4_9ACTN
MDRAQASAIAHRWHPIAAPVTDDNLRLLIQRLGLPPDGRILDLGCGFGEWLFAALEAAPGTTAVGVDTSGPALQEARARAAARNLADRATFEQADASGWSGEGFDAVLCIGATHAFGGLAATLAAVRAHLHPGGRVLLGEGYWEAPPSEAALRELGAEPGELPDIAGLVAEAQESGFEAGYAHLSTAAEWDEYEWCWTGALTEWALTEAPAEDRVAALELAREHRRQYLAGYRGELGFATVVLHDAAGGH